jgi:GntR family transcriptional regulator
MPIWAQIADTLRQRVTTQNIGPTSLSDAALSEEFGVSPLTVRQAIQQLVNEGLIIRQRGRGTFIAPQAFKGSLDHLEAFMQEWAVKGGNVRIELIDRSVIAASIPIATGLGIAPGEMVGYIRRLRRADSSPVAVDYRYIPARFNEQLEDDDLLHEAIWEIFQRKLGLSPKQSNTTIRAGTATEEETLLLNLGSGSPVLRRELQLLSLDDQILVTGQSTYHPERFVYATTIRTTRRHMPQEKPA